MRALALLSGGIDSPVAMYLMAKASADVIALHMDNSPYSENSDKAERLVRAVERALGREDRKDRDISLFTAPHGRHNLSVIAETENPHIRCVLCKRFMLRTAEALAVRERCDAIITGDSMGQVASQTLRNLKVEQAAIAMPVVRPLIGLDKEEIMRLARKIGTYEISIEDTGPCGIVPRKPSTRACILSVLEAERAMDVEGMVGATIGEAVRAKD